MSQDDPIFDAEPATNADDAAAGQRKPCPMCGEMIAAGAKVCRYCGHWLDPSMRPRGSSTSAAAQMLMPVNRPISAIAAGYLGLFAVLPFFGVIAIVVSLFALNKLKKNHELAGRGRAWFGLIMGTLTTLFWGFALFMAVTE